VAPIARGMSIDGFLPAQDGGDGPAAWVGARFRFEVTTSASSQAVQRRDLDRFLAFMRLEEGSEARPRSTRRLSRAFVDALRQELINRGRR